MKVVWKYVINSLNEALEMPKGARILSFQMQNAFACNMWALVDAQAPKEERRFVGIGTGEEIGEGGRIGINPERLEFIATVQAGEGGRIVHHFFEVK